MPFIIQRSVNVETPKAHIKLRECIPHRFSMIFDVPEVFKVNSQIIIRLAVMMFIVIITQLRH